MLRSALKWAVTTFQIKRDAVRFARSIGVRLGEECRLIGIESGTFGSEPYLVSIGNHVTITSGVRFITHDGGVWVFRHEFPEIDVIAPIKVGNNVFIGLNTIILPGVSIGDDCVIGAGSLLTKDIPARSVAAGVPARVIKPLEKYLESVHEKAIYIRSLPLENKRSFLQSRFLESDQL